MNPLPRVRAGLLRHPLDQQVLVYDSRDGLVHLLDPATACVMELLEEGDRTAEELIAQVGIRLDIAATPELLPLAIEELRKSNLLDLSVASPVAPLIDFNRRELLRKLALTGAAAFLVPAVATLSASRLYAQGSAQIGIGGSCTGVSQCLAPATNCCNGICTNGACGGSVAACGTCSPGSGTTQCATGTCGTQGACGSALTATGGACTSTPNQPSCTQGKNVADSKCCSGDCVGTCTGTGSNRTHSGTCA